MTINARGLFDSNTPNVSVTQAEERAIEQVQRDIFDSHRHRVFSLSFYMTSNELEAEQLLQNCFVRAFQAAPQPDAAIIDQALVTELRSSFPFTPAPTATARTSVAIGGNVRRTDFEEALPQLPPMERLLFLLRDVEGYNTEAISQLMGISQAETNRVLFSARIRLRGILAEIEASRAA